MKKFKFLSLFLTLPLFLAISVYVAPSSTFADDIDFPRTMLSDSQLSEYFKSDNVAQWPACYKANKEYEWRLNNWGRILRQSIKEKFLTEADFETVDFSLPGDIGFGNKPESEFFNPSGPFKATPMPQELLDALSTTKGGRLIFNIRRWFDKDLSQYQDNVPPQYIEVLVAILPDVISECRAPDGLRMWTKKDFKKQRVKILPDNRAGIVEEDEGYSNWRVTATNKLYSFKYITLRHTPFKSNQPK